MSESIEFKNFKALYDTTLPLGRFTLIVGPNGSGKTTALQAIQIVCNPGNYEYLQIASVNKRHSSADSVTVKISFESSIIPTIVRWDRAIVHYEPSNDLLVSRLCGVPIYSLDEKAISAPVALKQHNFLQANGGGLAGTLDQIRDLNPERFEEVNNTLHKWLPEFDRILFETTSQGQRLFMLRTSEGRHPIRASDLSQGTLLALALLTLAYLPDPPCIVCLEEPDRGIHPRLLRDVQDALYRLAYPENYGENREPVQVIATTHSPYFLDLFRDHPEEVVLANKTDEGTKFERLTDQPNLNEILEDSHLGEVWYTGILGGVPAHACKVAIFSESPADEAAIRVLINSMLGIETDEIGLPSLQGRGWPSVKASHPAVMKYLHYRTDAEALVIVADLDDSVIHQTAHEQADDRKCRLCFLRESMRETQSKLRARAGLAPLRIALGLALPAIEAWYLCGKEAQATEAACIQDKNKRTPEYKNKLKELVYGTSRPSLSLETQHAIEAAQRLAQDLTLLEQNFPLGFGALVQDLQSW